MSLNVITNINANVAQSVAHTLGKRKVGSSSLLVSSTYKDRQKF